MLHPTTAGTPAGIRADVMPYHVTAAGALVNIRADGAAYRDGASWSSWAHSAAPSESRVFSLTVF